MARTRQFDLDVALEQAMILFWDKGYEDTTFEELVNCTGVSRHSWYQVAKGKKEIYLMAVDRYCETYRRKNYGLIMEPEAGLPELFQLFKDLREQHESDDKNTGCMACTALFDRAPSDKELAEILDKAFYRLEATFRQVLENARRFGQLNDQVNVAEVAAALTAFIQAGGVMLQNPSTLPRLRVLLNAVLEKLPK